MNYIKEAENYLWYYGELQKSVDYMRMERSKIMAKSAPSGITNIAVSFEPTGVKTNHYDDAINDLYKIKILTENIRATEEALELINNILDEISQDEESRFYGEVLRRWYLEKEPKERIAAEIGYQTKKTIYEIRAKAIRKFAVRLFGIEALKVV